MWQKSSYCMVPDQTCVEVEWRKSSVSNSQGNCVETAQTGDKFAVRDSKNPDGPVLEFTGSEWKAFIEGVKLGEFDYSL